MTQSMDTVKSSRTNPSHTRYSRNFTARITACTLSQTRMARLTPRCYLWWSHRHPWPRIKYLWKPVLRMTPQPCWSTLGRYTQMCLKMTLEMDSNFLRSRSMHSMALARSRMTNRSRTLPRRASRAKTSASTWSAARKEGGATRQSLLSMSSQMIL